MTTNAEEVTAAMNRLEQSFNPLFFDVVKTEAADIALLIKAHKELSEWATKAVSDINWALLFLHTPSRAGMRMSRDANGKMEVKAWTTSFLETMKAIGIEYDEEILEYQRATQQKRKLMLKNSEFAAKLEQHAAKQKAERESNHEQSSQS